MRLPDFTFPNIENYPASFRARQAEVEQWIAKVSEENFIKAGIANSGTAEYLPGFLDSIKVKDSLLVDSVDTADASGSLKIISVGGDRYGYIRDTSLPALGLTKKTRRLRCSS